MTRPIPDSMAKRGARGFLLSLAALAIALPLAAWGRPVRVYEVDLAERSGTALQDAMRQALVRATGRREAADDPALAAIIADAPKYVAGYTSGARGQSQVVFDGPAVQQAVSAAGRSVWDGDRPFTLVVLDPPRARAQADAARAELERVAAARGLPISLIPMAVTDTTGKALSAEQLLEAAQRFGGDEILVGRGDGTGADGALQWTLYARGASESWSGPLAAGIDHTVDHLVPQQAGTATPAESEVRVEVEGVRTLTDYATLTRLLQATPAVRRANLLAAAPESLVFTATVRGGAAGLEQGLAGQAHLTRGTATAGRVQLHYQP
jgi:Uncharacterized protein conserved in bacteria (DUF2066)